MGGVKTIFDPRTSEELFSKRQFVLADKINVEGHDFSCDTILAKLEKILTSERVDKLKAVTAKRSFQMVSVLENIYDRGNISAVMRSADAFGFPQIHLVDQPDAKFKAANRVSKGSEKWLDVHLHKSVSSVAEDLRGKGYQLFATHLDAGRTIEELDFSRPMAIVLGNEKEGVSKEMVSECDGIFKIPMYGLSQSFNISVAAALIFYHARLHIKFGLDPKSEVYKQVLANYFLRCFESPEQLLKAIT